MERDILVSGIPTITAIVWTADGDDEVIYAAAADGRVSVAPATAGRFVDAPTNTMAGCWV